MKTLKPIACCVDSEEKHKESFKKSLAQKGLEVRFFGDGAKLISFLDAEGSKFRPSFILLDVCSNGIGGFEAARRLNQLSLADSIPVIMMAKHCSAEDKLEAQSAGAITCLQKPVSIESVEAEIEGKRLRQAKNQWAVNSHFK